MSFGLFCAHRVLRACDNLLEHIETERKKEDDAYIDKYHKKLNSKCDWRWIGGWFTPVSREEAIKQLHEECQALCYFGKYPSIYAHGDKYVAKKLRKLAKRADDGFIRVTAKDWEVLHRWDKSPEMR